MTRFGVEVSQGRDVTDTDPKDLLYSSDFPSPKTFAVLKGSFTTDTSGVATTTTPHGLMYAPAIFAYIKRDDGNWYSVDNANITAETSRSSVSLVVNTLNPLTASTQYFYKVYVFEDPAQDLTT